MSDPQGNHTCEHADEQGICLITGHNERCSGVVENCELQYPDEFAENVECCGQPCIYDEIDGEPMIWCPKCGKDKTYECHESNIIAQRTRIKREPSKAEISGIRRDED